MQGDTIYVEEYDKINGLYYIEDVVINSEHIINILDCKEWTNISKNINGRLVQHYGYIYDYRSRNARTTAPPFLPSLKDLKQNLSDMCVSLDLKTDTIDFNQCIVNNYCPGQGISKHIDSSVFGDVIGCYTLNSGCNMVFRHNDDVFKLYVKPNSLYIMSADARYKWTHEMESKKYDIVDGMKVDRTRRISITFRTMMQ
jgi:alkylated DNA repair dioxygenase AlkB